MRDTALGQKRKKPWSLTPRANYNILHYETLGDETPSNTSWQLLWLGDDPREPISLKKHKSYVPSTVTTLGSVAP